jgi:hypothetical protein
VEDAGVQELAVRGYAEPEQDQRERGGRGEADPGCDRAPEPALREPDADADLAARRAGQELAQGDEIGVGALPDPLAPRDELLAEVPEMRDGPPNDVSRGAKDENTSPVLTSLAPWRASLLSSCPSFSSARSTRRGNAAAIPHPCSAARGPRFPLSGQ